MTDDPDPIRVPSDATTPADPPIAPIPAEPEYYQPPRLGIIHLLAWITVSAVLFGFDGVLKTLDVAFKLSDVVRALQFVGLAGMAAGIVGLTALVRWRNRSACGPLAPGHWILIAEVVASLLSYCGDTANELLQPFAIPNQISLLAMEAAAMLVDLTRMSIYIWAALRIKENRGWRGIFTLLAIAAAIQACDDASSGLAFSNIVPAIAPFGLSIGLFSAAVEGITALVLFIFVVADRSLPRRDWLHVLGVALFILFSVTSVVYAVGLWLPEWLFGGMGL